MLTRPPLTLYHVRGMNLLGQQKNCRWTRLDTGKNMQQVAQAEYTGPCKRSFSIIDDHSELPCNKKQVLKDDAEFSSQMVEAIAQPCQEP